MMMMKIFLRTGIALSLVLLICLALHLPAAYAQNKPSRTPDIYFVPTPHDVVDVMLRLADVKKNDIVYDLGCGDGRIVIAAAKKAGARAFGFDIDPEMVETSRANVKKAGVENLVTIAEKDIFELDLRKASVVTLYLLPELNVRLIPQLDKLKPGTRIVSHDFDMEGVIPEVEATVNRRDGSISMVYLWTTPLKKITGYTPDRRIEITSELR
ncbi:MAG: methyltransferase domain-containing protein [Smithella sp.]|nr:methyltransferase domain-containing protein [Smithella sp.]